MHLSLSLYIYIYIYMYTYVTSLPPSLPLFWEVESLGVIVLTSTLRLPPL